MGPHSPTSGPKLAPRGPPKKITVEALTSEWFAARRSCDVTASLVGACAGVRNSYWGPEALVLKLAGVVDEKGYKPALEYGRVFEPVALAMLVDQIESHGNYVEQIPHALYTREFNVGGRPLVVGATPDAVLRVYPDLGEPGYLLGVEIKCPWSKRNDRNPDLKFTEQYYCQMQTQLNVADIDMGLFVQWTPHGGLHTKYVVRRNDQFAIMMERTATTIELSKSGKAHKHAKLAFATNKFHLPNNTIFAK